MKILLDTHILIWFHTRDSALSEKAWKILPPRIARKNTKKHVKARYFPN